MAGTEGYCASASSADQLIRSLAECSLRPSNGKAGHLACIYRHLWGLLLETPIHGGAGVSPETRRLQNKHSQVCADAWIGKMAGATLLQEAIQDFLSCDSFLQPHSPDLHPAEILVGSSKEDVRPFTEHQSLLSLLFALSEIPQEAAPGLELVEQLPFRPLQQKQNFQVLGMSEVKGTYSPSSAGATGMKELKMTPDGNLTRDNSWIPSTPERDLPAPSASVDRHLDEGGRDQFALKGEAMSAEPATFTLFRGPLAGQARRKPDSEDFRQNSTIENQKLDGMCEEEFRARQSNKGDCQSLEELICQESSLALQGLEQAAEKLRRMTLRPECPQSMGSLVQELLDAAGNRCNLDRLVAGYHRAALHGTTCAVDQAFVEELRAILREQALAIQQVHHSVDERRKGESATAENSTGLLKRGSKMTLLELTAHTAGLRESLDMLASACCQHSSKGAPLTGKQLLDRLFSLLEHGLACNLSLLRRLFTAGLKAFALEQQAWLFMDNEVSPQVREEWPSFLGSVAFDFADAVHYLRLHNRIESQQQDLVASQSQTEGALLAGHCKFNSFRDLEDSHMAIVLAVELDITEPLRMQCIEISLMCAGSFRAAVDSESLLRWLQKHFLFSNGTFGNALVEGLCTHANSSALVSVVQWQGIIDQAAQAMSYGKIPSYSLIGCLRDGANQCTLDTVKSTGLSSLQLTMQPRFPVSELITAAALEIYGAIASSLMELCLVRQKLQQTWSCMLSRTTAGQAHSRLTTPHLLRLKADRVTQIIQSTVLLEVSAAWQSIYSAVKGEWSMKGLHQLHSCFLEACQSATFTDRDSADIRDQLTAVLQSVLNFCQEVEMNRSTESQIRISSKSESYIDAMAMDFERKLRGLEMALERQSNHRLAKTLLEALHLDRGEGL